VNVCLHCLPFTLPNYIAFIADGQCKQLSEANKDKIYLKRYPFQQYLKSDRLCEIWNNIKGSSMYTYSSKNWHRCSSFL